MMLLPTSDNVIVRIKRNEPNQVTTGGIIIPKASNEKQDQGTIVALGSGRILNDGTHIPMQVSIGDEIIFNKFAGTEIESEDDLFLIIRENDILAIIKKEE